MTSGCNNKTYELHTDLKKRVPHSIGLNGARDMTQYANMFFGIGGKTSTEWLK
jgi:hypothetical protein